MTQPTDKVREAFEQDNSHLYLSVDRDGNYDTLSTEHELRKYRKAYKAGRTNALNEAIELCTKQFLTEASDYPYDRGWSNAAKRLSKEFKELRDGK